MQQRADLERRMVSGFMRWLDRKERLVVIHVVLSILSKSYPSYPAKDCENACFSVAWMCNSLRRRFHRVRATPTVRRRRLRPRHFSQSGRCLLHHRSESPRRSLLSLAWSGSIHVPPSRTRSLCTPRSSCPLTHTRPHGRSSRLDVRDALRFTWLLKRTFLRSAYVDRPQSHNVLVRIECLSALIAQDSND